MNDLTALLDRMRTQRPVAWDQLPDFALYMDQVLSYMDRQVLRFDEEDALTASLVNNYTKSGLVPRAEGKKYNREHLAYLTAICVLKRVMSTRDMDLLIREELRGERTVEDGYTAFCESLNSALQAMAQDRGMMAVRMSGMRFDAGDWAEFLTANIYFALQDEELRYELLGLLKNFVQFQ